MIAALLRRFARRAVPPYSIGANHLPGLSKLIEEAGEVQQVAGKILGIGAAVEHWDGTDLRQRLTEEMGDLCAAIEFVMAHNDIDHGALRERRNAKRAQFEQWHNAPRV